MKTRTRVSLDHASTCLFLYFSTNPPKPLVASRFSSTAVVVVVVDDDDDDDDDDNDDAITISSLSQRVNE